MSENAGCVVNMWDNVGTQPNDYRSNRFRLFNKEMLHGILLRSIEGFT